MQMASKKHKSASRAIFWAGLTRNGCGDAAYEALPALLSTHNNAPQRPH